MCVFSVGGTKRVQRQGNGRPPVLSHTRSPRARDAARCFRASVRVRARAWIAPGLLKSEQKMMKERTEHEKGKIKGRVFNLAEYGSWKVFGV